MFALPDGLFIENTQLMQCKTEQRNPQFLRDLLLSQLRFFLSEVRLKKLKGRSLRREINCALNRRGIGVIDWRSTESRMSRRINHRRPFFHAAHRNREETAECLCAQSKRLLTWKQTQV